MQKAKNEQDKKIERGRERRNQLKVSLLLPTPEDPGMKDDDVC